MSKHFLLLVVILALAGVSGWWVWSQPTRQGLDVKGGIRMTLRAKVEDLPQNEQQLWNTERLNLTADILRKRIDILGVLEPGVFTKGTQEMVVELPGFTNEEEARSLLQSTAQLEFRYINNVRSSERADTASRRYEIIVEKNDKNEEVVRFRDYGDLKDPGKVIKEGTPEYLEILKNSEIIIKGDDLSSASVAQSSALMPQIVLNLKSEGQDKFAKATSLHVKEHIAIVMDNEVISAPVVQEGNLRDPVINGSFTVSEATRLAQLLNAGALPVALSIESVTQVEPTLGAQAWERIMQAGIIGTIIVVLFMVVYYLLPGFISVLALGLYILFSIAAFKALGVTFSLPAIAGFILSIGMAVDANILIFERIKEELRLGKTLLASIDAGFKRAFTAIFDSNMATVITSAILYYYGTGPVQGFATTLALGVMISFFTAITCTRTLLYALVGIGIHPSVGAFGLRRQWGTTISEGMATEKTYDFVSKRKIYYAISLVAIVIGLAGLFTGGLKLGIDFEGGSELVMASPQPITAKQADIVNALGAANFKKVGIQYADGGKQVIMHVADAKDTDKDKLIAAIAPLDSNMKEVSFASISPRVQKEIIQNALKAIFLSVIFILFYITLRFSIEGGWSGFKYGLAALTALVHDVAITVGIASLFGHLMGWEVNSLFITALLTLIGFSVHDTIVVFDRTRENLKYRTRGETFVSILNKSLTQTLARSINTSLTLILVLVALLILGAVTTDLRFFYVAMLAGAIVGVYSSIFIASQLLVDWQSARDRALERQAAAARATAIAKSESAKTTDESTNVEAAVAREKPAASSAARAPKRKRRY